MKDAKGFTVKVLTDSVKFYLPRVEGYLEVVREMASEHQGMSLIEFDGYFEGKPEPVKYVRLEIHINSVDELEIVKRANQIRTLLRQRTLAFEYNNKLVLIEADSSNDY